MGRNYAQEQREWSHLIDIDDIESGPKVFTFEANERQRIDLARRTNVISIESASASVTLQKVGGGIIHAMGTVRADMTQNCVVTLTPIPTHAEDEFEGWFGDKDSAVSFVKARTEREAKKGHIEAEILEESVDPEPIAGGKVDVGELATQFLSLAIPPYPRAEGVSGSIMAGPKEKPGEGASFRKNPFEALKDWKEKR